MSTEGCQTEQAVEQGIIIHWIPPAQLPALLEYTHPACACFRPSKIDVEQMIVSVRRDGFRQPVTRLDGKLLDGQTRASAADYLQLAVPCRDLPPEELADKSPFDWVLQANQAAACSRRLSDTQIALAVMKNQSNDLVSLQAEAQRRMRGGVAVGLHEKGTFLEKLAARYDLKVNRLKNAWAIVAAADDALYAAAFSSEISLSAAAKLATKCDRVARPQALALEVAKRQHPHRSKSKSHEEGGDRNASSPPTSLIEARHKVAAELKVLQTCEGRLSDITAKFSEYTKAHLTLANACQLFAIANTSPNVESEVL